MKPTEDNRERRGELAIELGIYSIVLLYFPTILPKDHAKLITFIRYHYDEKKPHLPFPNLL